MEDFNWDFNAKARQYRTLIRHILLREDFHVPARHPLSNSVEEKNFIEDEITECGISLFMESPHQSVDIAFRIDNHGLEYRVFSDAMKDDSKTLVEAEIPFSLIPEKLIKAYETGKDETVKSEIMDHLMKAIKAEGFAFIADDLGRFAFEQVFNFWYREEIENRPQDLRTWQLPSPGVK